MQDSLKIEGLQPLIVPEPVSFWPPAPAWYVLGAVLFAILIFLVYRFIKLKRQNKYRQIAAQQLLEIKSLLKDPTRRQNGLMELNSLLKRVALKAYERRKVASLSGEAWSTFLNETSKNIDFKNYPGNYVVNSGFVKNEDLNKMTSQDIDELLLLTKKWIINHRT